jgi:hypothetical protein
MRKVANEKQFSSRRTRLVAPGTIIPALRKVAMKWIAGSPVRVRTSEEVIVSGIKERRPQQLTYD